MTPPQHPKIRRAKITPITMSVVVDADEEEESDSSCFFSSPFTG